MTTLLLFASITSGEQIQIEGISPKHPFQHLIYIPAHESAYTIDNYLSFGIKLGGIVNSDSTKKRGDWASKFNGNMLDTSIESAYAISDSIDLELEIQGGKIFSDDGITLNKNSTTFLPESNLNLDISTIRLGVKLELFRGKDVVLSYKPDFSLQMLGDDSFMSSGSTAVTQTFLATINIWKNHRIHYNIGISFPGSEDVFTERLRPSSVKFLSGSYSLELGPLTTAIIYETSTPLLRRVETINERVSSLSLLLQLKVDNKKGCLSINSNWFIIVSRGTVNNSFDYAVLTGYKLNL